MKTINLSILDRLLLPLFYPQSEGLIEMDIVWSIQDKIRFTPSEIEEYELKDLPDGKVSWNKLKAKDREFPLEDSEIRILQKEIDTLDKGKKIMLSTVVLAKRIMNLNKKE